ncbi:histidine kinase [Methylobacterium sp. Leaf456]|uniref:sensor histidine kinase n=1 Tax=Methylobacterium sp. Leaf456 TaxID=1736382 RepID=UPI0006F9AD91|nr:HWE histidine kinase domain-containing protein [Methylobacterium sp. Leaf456]KQT61430.1 histidine kinase [Methylobacterium sp. Leaf456]
MTLTGRILLLVLLALAPAVAVQVYNEQALRESRSDAVRAAALRGAQAVAADLGDFADGARQTLDILAEEPAIRNRDAAACSAFLGAVAGRISGSQIIVVTDREGSLVCNSRGAAPGAYSLADRGYFKRAMETGSSAVGEYVIGRGTGRPTIQFAHPLHDAAGAIDGLINLGFDPEWLGRRLGNAGLPRDATVTVTDRNGTVLVRLPDTEAWLGRSVPRDFADGLERALAGGGVREMAGLRGNMRITGVVRPDGALDGITVVVGLNRTLAFADIDAATRRGAVLIALGSLIAVLAALWGGRRFIRHPVRQLLDAAGAWSAGDLGVRSGLTGTSEFGKLGRAFDRMAADLQRHEESLKAELSKSQALQEQQVTMLHELNHRVKNTLATVQSLARQSRGGEEQVVQLENRILALSKTHDLLTRRDWTRAPLRQVLENELSPYRSGEDHVTLTGEEVELPPRYVLALGMTAHELTTNAAKYGALSTDEGRVSVTWRVGLGESGRERLHIEWRETGGPPVSQPRRRGFGSRLITGGIARELDGDVRLDFAPEGLRCIIDVPLEREAAPPIPFGGASRRTAT